MENEVTLPTETEPVVITDTPPAEEAPVIDTPAPTEAAPPAQPPTAPVIVEDAPPAAPLPAPKPGKPAKRDSSVVTSIRFTAEEWAYLQTILEARTKHISKKTGKPLSESMHNMLRQLINYGINHDAHPDWFFSKPHITPVYFK